MEREPYRSWLEEMEKGVRVETRENPLIQKAKEISDSTYLDLSKIVFLSSFRS